MDLCQHKEMEHGWNKLLEIPNLGGKNFRRRMVAYSSRQMVCTITLVTE